MVWRNRVMAWTDEFTQDSHRWDLPPGYAITPGSPETFEIRDPTGRVLLTCRASLPVGRPSAGSFRHLLERLAWQLWVSERDSPMPTLRFWLSSGEATNAATRRGWAAWPRGVIVGAAVAAATILIAIGGPTFHPAQVAPSDVRLPMAPPPEAAAMVRPSPPAPGFAVQFGRFLDRDRAEARAQLIRTMGYVAVVREAGEGFAVFSRGYATRALAEQWQDVFSTLGIKSRVVLREGMPPSSPGDSESGG